VKQYQQQSTAPVTATARPKALRLADRRLALKPELARSLRVDREQAGISQRDLAAELQVQPSHLARCELAAEPHALTELHLAAAAESPVARGWGLGRVRWLASRFAAVVLERPEPVHGDDHGARLASVTVECSDPVRALAVAQADGSFSIDELEQIEREAREGAQALLELQSWAAERIRKAREG
jgi:transcriptional regulator with XRE-family HTH domain